MDQGVRRSALVLAPERDGTGGGAGVLALGKSLCAPRRWQFGRRETGGAPGALGARGVFRRRREPRAVWEAWERGGDGGAKTCLGGSSPRGARRKEIASLPRALSVTQ